MNPYFNQKKLIAFCKERDVAVMSYSPFYAIRRLGCVDHGLNMFEEPALKELAEKHQKTVAQIILRYLVRIMVHIESLGCTLYLFDMCTFLFQDTSGHDSRPENG